MFLKTVNKRIKILFLLMLIMFTIIVIRVLFIEVIDYNKLKDYASSLWSRELPVEADRGIITDRNGEILADNLTTTSLFLIPNQIENKEEVTKNLAEILNVSYEKMKKHVYKETSIERVHPEGRRLSFEIADKINSLHYEGVYLIQ